MTTRTLAPRERFQQDKDAVKRHWQVADDEGVRATLETALNVLTCRYTKSSDANSPVNFYRIQGAKELIDTWLTLGDPEIKPKRPLPDSLEPEDPLK